MGICPYCNQGEISERSTASVWADFLAKALNQARVFFEIRVQSGFSMKRLFKAYVDSDSLPLATEEDRLCPFCRRGHVTRASEDAIWPDLAVRLMGMGRTYLELRGNKDGFPLRELAYTIVEGDMAQIPTDNSFSDITVEVTDVEDDDDDGYEVYDDDDDDDDAVEAEAVDSTPFDDSADGKGSEPPSQEQTSKGFDHLGY